MDIPNKRMIKNMLTEITRVEAVGVAYGKDRTYYDYTVTEGYARFVGNEYKSFYDNRIMMRKIELSFKGLFFLFLWERSLI